MISYDFLNKYFCVRVTCPVTCLRACVRFCVSFCVNVFVLFVMGTSLHLFDAIWYTVLRNYHTWYFVRVIFFFRVKAYGIDCCVVCVSVCTWCFFRWKTERVVKTLKPDIRQHFYFASFCCRMHGISFFVGRGWWGCRQFVAAPCIFFIVVFMFCCRCYYYYCHFCYYQYCCYYYYY